MTLVYVSGRGADSTERGRSMWARVKGQTENALLRLPFKAAYMFRIGAVLPLHGIKSKTPLYNFSTQLGRPYCFCFANCPCKMSKPPKKSAKRCSSF